MNEHTGPILPHTRINPMTRIRIERTLPMPGEILVQRGERVGALQKVARTTVHGEIRVVNVARVLGLKDLDLSGVMVKKRGDRVEAGETIAARRGALPFLYKPCRSPVAGRLAAIEHGRVVIEAEAEPVDLLAFVPGQVVTITDYRSVTIETTGAHIVGACGIGDEGHGVLQVAVDDPGEALTPDDIEMGFNNAIMVGGAGVSPETLARAREMKVSGIIVGGISASLHDHPPPPFPVMATEGYGIIPMSPAVFEILKQLEGHEACISGRMGEPWDSTRPMLIVSLEGFPQDADSIPESEPFPHRSNVPGEPARIGDRVRGVRQPLLGQVGEIVTVQEEFQPVPSGIPLAGIQIHFAGEDHQFVPWLNLELIADG